MYIRVVANYKFDSYWKLMLRLFYATTPWAIWVLVCVPLLVISNLYEIPNRANKMEALFFFLLWLLLFPAIIYYSSRKKFYSNGKLSNPVIFEITEEKMTITTTSSNSSLRWDDRCYLIRVFKNWIVIYKVINRRRFPIEIIPRELLSSEQLNEIKLIVLAPPPYKRKWLIILVIILLILLLNYIFLFRSY
jgi:hypothetical protein